MNRENAAYASEARVQESKPILRALLDDLRAAAEQARGGRKDALETLLAAFDVALGDAKYEDVTEAEADAFREQWEVPKR